MKCLNCGKEMVNILAETMDRRIAYDVCEACGGLWLDKGELDKMAFEVDGSIEFSSKARADEPAPDRTCPRCDGQTLDKARFIGYSDVVLDRCDNCGGFWVDGGELDAINAELASIMPVHGRGFADFVKGVHIPYLHKRLRRPSSETDFKVAVPPIQGARRLSDTDLPCPACEATLGRYKAFGIEFEGCGRCKGMFLDTDELRKLKDRVTADLWSNLRWADDDVEAVGKTKAVVSARRCCKCPDARMLTVLLGPASVPVDVCPKCRAVWLDREEFDEIIEALRAEVDALSSKEMAGEVVEEVKEIWSGPEWVGSEVRDAVAAVATLINLAIMERPALHKTLTKLADAGRGLGLG